MYYALAPFSLQVYGELFDPHGSQIPLKMLLNLQLWLTVHHFHCRSASRKLWRPTSRAQFLVETLFK
jgi:hypothetical protein